jgi:catechol 2,3-dioxygenase-like lactoylglutathione lyase family enzyme
MKAGELRVDQVVETCLYVPDLVAAEAFYATVLGLSPVQREDGRHVFFRCGQQMLLVFNPAVTSDETDPFGVPRHGAWGRGHVAFAANEGDLPAWRERLEAHGVAIEQDMIWPNGGRSIYFRDPAGNSVELVTLKLWGLPD